MIPNFSRTGYLPAGIHQATWDEFCTSFGWNDRRCWLIEGLRPLLDELARVHCEAVYVDGSFVTVKELPGDYDLCWKMTGVFVESLDPVLLDYSMNGKKAIEKKYRGDIRGAEFRVHETGELYLDFFQHDLDGTKKGIVELSPSDGV